MISSRLKKKQTKKKTALLFKVISVHDISKKLKGTLWSFKPLCGRRQAFSSYTLALQMKVNTTFGCLDENSKGHF